MHRTKYGSLYLAMDKLVETDAVLLDVKLLRLLDLLYTTRSVTRSAEQLGQSQPTVSIWLGRLRHELKDPLFVRTPGGMEPTPRADALIGTARAALEALRRLSTWEPEFTPATAQRRFRICMTDASHITLLPQLLEHVRAAAPCSRLEALRIDDETGYLLQSGEADLALGLIPDLEAGFYQQTLFTQDWVCLANPAHPRVIENLTVDAYQSEAHIAIVAGTGQHLLNDALHRARIERRVVLDLPGFLGLSAIILATDLVATLPRHTGETLAKASGLRLFPCPFSVPSFSVKQHWHARYHHDEANRWLRHVCAKLFQRRADHGSGEGA